MIANLLPEYYERYEDNLRYEVLRSIVIDGHEVAWMSYAGTVEFDITGQGREGEAFSGRTMMCECDFTEGIGWNIDAEGRHYTVSGQDAQAVCLIRQAAMHLRHLELRREYWQRFVAPKRETEPWAGLTGSIREIVLDLIAKDQSGEWLEPMGGAAFYGGSFYLQTLAAIMNEPMGYLWELIYPLAADKLITLEGAIVKPYTTPPPPEWEEFLRIEDGGWTGTASLPGHRQMAREWHFTVLNPAGKQAIIAPGMRLLHDPVFGPDVEDVERARTELRRLLDYCLEHTAAEAEEEV